MKLVYADASYWIALLHPKDKLHNLAKRESKTLKEARIVTSEMILSEVLNSLAKYGKNIRNAAVQFIHKINKNPNVDIVPQTSLQFQKAVDYYSKRNDKQWGLTDCASFIIMEEKGIKEVLTSDHHFKQAGFKILIPGNN